MLIELGPELSPGTKGVKSCLRRRGEGGPAQNGTSAIGYYSSATTSLEKAGRKFAGSEPRGDIAAAVETVTSSQTDPARILIVMAAQWPRALLRAELREANYDAVGARDLDEAASYPSVEAGRGPVRLIILDQAVIPSSNDPRLKALLHAHPEAQTVLLMSAFQPPLPGKWTQVLRHPTTIAEITQVAQRLLPPTQEFRPLGRQ